MDYFSMSMPFFGFGYLLLKNSKKNNQDISLSNADLIPMKYLRQKVTKLDNGSIIVKPYQSNIEGDIEEQTIQYPKGHENHVVVGENATKKIFLSKKGVSSIKPQTIAELFKVAVERNGDNIALVTALPDKRTWTWKQYFDESIIAARSLITFGFQAGNTVNLIGFNSPEYFLFEMGAIFAHGKAAGIYTTNNPEACHYVSEHSNAIAVAVQNLIQLNKFLEIRSRLPNLRVIVCWGMTEDEIPKNVSSQRGGAGENCEILTWKQFMDRGKESDVSTEQEVLKRVEMIDAGDTVALIYTSGTTGNPKAVMISNDNVIFTSRYSWSCRYGDVASIPSTETSRQISYLPLSHIAAQVVDIFSPIFGTAVVGLCATVYFADEKALKGSLPQTLQLVRPHAFFGVPRVWEKFMEGIQQKSATATGIKKHIVSWARNIGAQYLQAIQNDGKKKNLKIPVLYPIAKILLDKIRKAIGFDDCQVFSSGAAPINSDILLYLGSLGMPVLEVYGMSESTGPQTGEYISTSREALGFQIGSCGSPVPGSEMLILHDPKRDPPGNGEVCYRGRHIMMGYMGDYNKTIEAIDEDGWLHSGDVGRVDDDGMLYITGRIKELIITKGGENIPPVPIEEMIKSLLPGISNFVMIGDKRHFCSALITIKLKPNPDLTFSNELDQAALKAVPEYKTIEEAATSEAWRKYIQKGIDKYNSEVAVSQAQKIQKFVILSTDFSLPGGELGPTLKLKRNEVYKKYVKEIESIYIGLE